VYKHSGTLCVAGKSFSKKVTRAAEQQRADVQVKRRWWDILVSRQPIGDLVFLDETGANTKMIRRYGWGPRSSRVIADVPHGHWKTTTFVAGFRTSGFIAPLVVDGPMNGDVFLAYVEQQLVSTLKPGDLVIMDNLSCHKRAGVQEAIESVGAELMYLPPYSPDLEFPMNRGRSSKSVRSLEERNYGSWKTETTTAYTQRRVQA